MAQIRGMGSIKGAVSDNKKMSAGKFFRRLKVEDRDTAPVLFIANEKTEPFISTEHSFREGAKFGSIIHRDEHCVPCHANASGDRRVNRPSLKACFSLYDLRWARKKRDAEKSTKEREAFEYLPLDEDDVTAKGIAKGIHVRRGRCGWDMATQWANAIDSVNTQARKRCKSCGKGKITLKCVINSEGKRVNHENFDEMKLQKLLDSGKFKEKLQCSKCDEPVRMTIFNSIVLVTRTGEGTSTSYQFQITNDDIPDDVQELFADKKKRPEPLEWEMYKEAESAEAQARELSVKNPFKGKGSSSDDDDDDDGSEDYDDDDDDDDDFSDPFGDDSPKKKSKKKSSKSNDDDDDDEEASSDDDDEDSDDDDDEPVKPKKKKAKVADDEEEDRPKKKKKKKLKLISKKKRVDDDDDTPF